MVATDSWGDNTITDNNKAWGTNLWAPGIVWYSIFTLMEIRRIESNTSTTVTAESNWDISPMLDTVFEVLTTATWSLNNEITGDNISGDGTTNITWDLE